MSLMGTCTCQRQSTDQVEKTEIFLAVELRALLKQRERQFSPTAVKNQRLEHFVRCIAKEAPIGAEDSREDDWHNDIYKQDETVCEGAAPEPNMAHTRSAYRRTARVADVAGTPGL